MLKLCEIFALMNSPVSSQAIGTGKVTLDPTFVDTVMFPEEDALCHHCTVVLPPG